MNELNSFLSARGYAAALGLPLDGAFHRFDRGGSLSGWFKGIKAGEVVLAAMGDWKTGEALEYKGMPTGMSLEEQVRLDVELKAMVAQGEVERKHLQVQVAIECEAKWAAAIDRGVTPYLAKKGLAKLYGAKICPEFTDTLLVPARDVTGKLWGIQRILPQKLDSGLDKLFTKGMRIEGCFHTIGEISPEGEIYVCEGFATAASVFEAISGGGHGSPFAAVSAFNAGNLPAVASALKAHYPNARLFICADNDLWTEKQGKPWNPGLEKADAARTLVGGELRVPVFKSLDSRPTDFNDLACLEGLEAVKQQLLNPPKEEAPSAGSEFNPLIITSISGGVTKTGIPLPPRQQRIIEHALNFFAGRLMKQDRDLFYYVGTHWQLLTLMEHDKLKVMMQRICAGIADVKLVDAAYKLFIYHLPSPPPYVDFFVPHPFCVNFTNGTLHLLKSGRGFKTEFRKHSHLDFLTHVLPYEFRAGDTETNTEFLGMLNRVFQGDEDKADKIRAVKQMFGACLLPAFPRLFMLHGKPGTGKSTVLNIAARLVHKDNLCSVPPSQWTGFNMEGMAMKLVNVDTDIPLNEPLSDDLIKKVIERKPFRIRRKGIKDLMAPIPAVHMFGGNDLPKTLDGASRAHSRRWTFVEFKAFVPSGNYDQFYWDFCFDQSPQGVLNFALEGLADLCASGGHFTNPVSGIEAIEEMQDRNDMVARFLKDVAEHEVPEKYRQWKVDPTARIERKEVWLGFIEWHAESFRREPGQGKSVFYNALRAKLGREIKSEGLYYFRGLGHVSEGTAPF